MNVLMAKIRENEFPLSDIWITEKDFAELGPDYFRKCVLTEDLQGFIDELGGIDGFLECFEFYWSPK